VFGGVRIAHGSESRQVSGEEETKMPWFTVRTREVWDATHLVEATRQEEAIQSVIDGRSGGTSEFAYLLKDDIECEEAEPPFKGPATRR
jgi:hypothetical protein